MIARETRSTERTGKKYYMKKEMNRDKKEDSHGCEPARMGHGLVSLFLSGGSLYLRQLSWEIWAQV